jgi:hypothetical protein
MIYLSNLSNDGEITSARYGSKMFSLLDLLVHILEVPMGIGCLLAIF